MLEIIVFIIIISVIIQNSKKKGTPQKTPPFAAGQKPVDRTPSSRSEKPAKTAPKAAPKKQQRKSRQTLFSRPSSGEDSPIRPRPEEPLETRTFIEPTKAYRPPLNAGERYEEWMPVPEGKRVCRCGYCGADNLIPKHSDPKDYSCYFCREEL